MTQPNAIAEELAELGKSDKRLISKIEAATKALEANRARRCAILHTVAQLACDAGQLDGDVTAAVVEPKRDD